MNRTVELLYFVEFGSVIVAITVMLYVPLAAEPVFIEKSVLLLSLAGVGFGVKFAVAPEGRPDMLMLTGYVMEHESVPFAERLNENWQTCTVTLSLTDDPGDADTDLFEGITVMNICE